MMISIIRNLTTDVVSKALDGYAARQKAISSNIANSETPNYKRRDVAFQDELGLALEDARTHQHQVTHVPDGFDPMKRSPGDIAMGGGLPQHYGVLLNESADAVLDKHGKKAYSNVANPVIGQIDLSTTVDETFHYRNDGNGVDLEHEMVDLARNSSRFKSTASLQGKLSQQMKGLLSGLQ